MTISVKCTYKCVITLEYFEDLNTDNYIMRMHRCDGDYYIIVYTLESTYRLF